MTIPADLSPKLVGVVFRDLADAGILRRVGFQNSTRPAARPPVVRVALADAAAAARPARGPLADPDRSRTGRPSRLCHLTTAACAPWLVAGGAHVAPFGVSIMNLTNAFNDGNGNGDNGKTPSGFGGFDDAKPAPGIQAAPPGIYMTRVQRGEVCSTKAGADAYRMKFEVTEGPQAGQTVIRTWTFSEKAIRYTRRDLEPFGLITTAKLLSPFPEPGREYVVRLAVAAPAGTTGLSGTTSRKSNWFAWSIRRPPRSCCPDKSKGGRSDPDAVQRRRVRVGRDDIPALVRHADLLTAYADAALEDERGVPVTLRLRRGDGDALRREPE